MRVDFCNHPRLAQYVKTWQTTSTGDWSIASNWYPSFVPTSSDSVFIVNGGTATITQAGAECFRLTLGGTATGTIQMIAGSLTETNPTYGVQIGNARAGSIVQSGGTISIANGLFLGNEGGGNGAYAMSGGSLYVAGPNLVEVGNAGPGSFAQSGGICNFATELDLGYDVASTGTYNLSGSGLLSAQHLVIGNAQTATGVFTQTGGTNSVSNGLVLAQNSSSAGTYNLNGGLLVLAGSSSTLMQGSGSASFNLGGGTLRTGSSFSTSLPMSFSPGSAALFDTGGNTLSLVGNLVGSGSLTKTGAGTLVLSGTNTYSGGTTVSAGTLRVTSLASLPSGSRLTIGGNASVYFHSPVVPGDAADGAQAVPEPSTLAILGIGAIGITCLRRFARAPHRHRRF